MPIMVRIEQKLIAAKPSRLIEKKKSLNQSAEFGAKMSKKRVSSKYIRYVEALSAEAKS